MGRGQEDWDHQLLTLLILLHTHQTVNEKVAFSDLAKK
jgi:hypothetical protein